MGTLRTLLDNYINGKPAWANAEAWKVVCLGVNRITRKYMSEDTVAAYFGGADVHRADMPCKVAACSGGFHMGALWALADGKTDLEAVRIGLQVAWRACDRHIKGDGEEIIPQKSRAQKAVERVIGAMAYGDDLGSVHPRRKPGEGYAPSAFIRRAGSDLTASASIRLSAREQSKTDSRLDLQAVAGKARRVISPRKWDTVARNLRRFALDESERTEQGSARRSIMEVREAVTR